MGTANILGALQLSDSNTITILLAATAIIGAAALLQVFVAWRRLRHIPGPFLNSITPLVLTWHCLKEDITKYTYGLSMKYGELVRVSPNIVMFSDPDTFRHICTVKAGYTKGLWFEFSRWDLTRYSIIAMRDNESRKARKSKLSPAWIGQGLAIMESRVDRQVRSFLDLVERKYVSSAASVRPMEFGHRAQYFTLDVVTDVTFGKPFGFLIEDRDVESYLETTETMIPMFGILGTLPWLVYILHRWPFSKVLPGEGDQLGFGRLMKFASEAVQKRLQPDDASSKHDLIRAYLDAGVEPEDVVQECITLVVAGSETTSVAIRMTLLSLLSTPQAYRKLQAEIDGYYSQKSKRDAGGDSIISYSDAKASLPYLQGAIREAIRLWPPSAGLFTKEVPKEGDTIHGYYLPPGTEVGQSNYGIGRRQSLWGPDVEIFRPERWLEASPERLQEMLTASDLNWSAGKYLCLGKPIAWMEMTKWFVEILRRYDIAIVNPPQPLKMRDPITWVTTDFWIRFTKRDKPGA